MKTHQEIAAPFKEKTHAISNEDIHGILATDSLYSVETGFNIKGEKQAVPVRVLRGLGHTARETYNIIELMAVTDEPGRDDTALHGATVAALTGANVIAVGNPGVEYGRLSVMEEGQLNKLTSKQKEALEHGNFEPVAQAIAHAAMNALETEGLEDLDTYVVAPSLSSSIASAGVSHMVESGMNLRGIALIDPVGLSPKPGMSRVKEFLKVNESSAPYLDANHPLRHEIGEAAGLKGLREALPWLIRSANSLGANISYGYHGIGKGDARAELNRHAMTMRRNDIGLHIYAAGKSEFNTVPMSEQTVEDLLRLGANASSIVIEGASHAMTMMAAMHAEAAKGFRLKI